MNDIMETVKYSPYYKISWKGRLATYISYLLPKSVRAAIEVDLLDKLYLQCVPVHEINDDGSEIYHDTISAIGLETLRRAVIICGLGGVLQIKVEQGEKSEQV